MASKSPVSVPLRVWSLATPFTSFRTPEKSRSFSWPQCFHLQRVVLGVHSQDSLSLLNGFNAQLEPK